MKRIIIGPRHIGMAESSMIPKALPLEVGEYIKKLETENKELQSKLKMETICYEGKKKLAFDVATELGIEKDKNERLEDRLFAINQFLDLDFPKMTATEWAITVGNLKALLEQSLKGKK